MVSLSGLLFLVAVLLPTHSAFEEKDIQCQDPIDPSSTITVKSSLICDEVQNCFQSLDERRDLCGNMYGIQLQENRQRELSVYLRWSVAYHGGSMWGSSAEERRVALFGPRMEPDGCFLTRKSDTGSSTVKLRASRYDRYAANDLKPWTNYTFFLRPYVNSEENALGYRIGAALTVTLRTRFSAARNVTLTPLDGNRAVISWEATGYVEYFQVLAFDPYSTLQYTLTVEGSDTPVRTYNVLETAPLSEGYYRVRSCVRSECSDDTTLHLTTPAYRVRPAPSIITVAAVSDTSFVLEWRVDNEDRDHYDGFAVRYYAASSTSCHEITVGEETRNLTVGNLHPNTAYAIKLHLRLRAPGNGMTLGKPAQAVVSTWSSVPLAPLMTDKPLLSSSDSVLYAWTLFNSSLRYMQYSLNGEDWHNCSETYHCTVTYIRPDHPHSFAIEGTVKVWSLRPFTAYTFFARACNDAGCGGNASIQHTTEMREPSRPENLQVASFENGTTLILWDAPSEPGGPLDGYEVYRNCPGRLPTCTDVTATAVQLSDIPEGVNCSWSVLAYHYTREGHLLRGSSSEYDTEDIVDHFTLGRQSL